MRLLEFVPRGNTIRMQMTTDSRRSAMNEWVPLMEYANRMGLSLSTLRRHIKAKKVPFRIENGKYLLLCQGSGSPSSSSDRVQELERDLKRAREEIAELKTLIALYEETPSSARRLAT